MRPGLSSTSPSLSASAMNAARVAAVRSEAAAAGRSRQQSRSSSPVLSSGRSRSSSLVSGGAGAIQLSSGTAQYPVQVSETVSFLSDDTTLVATPHPPPVPQSVELVEHPPHLRGESVSLQAEESSRLPMSRTSLEVKNIPACDAPASPPLWSASLARPPSLPPQLAAANSDELASERLEGARVARVVEQHDVPDRDDVAQVREASWRAMEEIVRASQLRLHHVTVEATQARQQLERVSGDYEEQRMENNHLREDMQRMRQMLAEMQEAMQLDRQQRADDVATIHQRAAEAQAREEEAVSREQEAHQQVAALSAQLEALRVESAVARERATASSLPPSVVHGASASIGGHHQPPSVVFPQSATSRSASSLSSHTLSLGGTLSRADTASGSTSSRSHTGGSVAMQLSRPASVPSLAAPYRLATGTDYSPIAPMSQSTFGPEGRASSSHVSFAAAGASSMVPPPTVSLFSDAGVSAIVQAITANSVGIPPPMLAELSGAAFSTWRVAFLAYLASGAPPVSPLRCFSQVAMSSLEAISREELSTWSARAGDAPTFLAQVEALLRPVDVSQIITALKSEKLEISAVGKSTVQAVFEYARRVSPLMQQMVEQERKVSAVCAIVTKNLEPVLPLVVEELRTMPGATRSVEEYWRSVHDLVHRTDKAATLARLHARSAFVTVHDVVNSSAVSSAAVSGRGNGGRNSGHGDSSSRSDSTSGHSGGHGSGSGHSVVSPPSGTFVGAGVVAVAPSTRSPLAPAAAISPPSAPAGSAPQPRPFGGRGRGGDVPQSDGRQGGVSALPLRPPLPACELCPNQTHSREFCYRSLLGLTRGQPMTPEQYDAARGMVANMRAQRGPTR